MSETKREDIIESLRKRYKYIRFIELHEEVMFESNLVSFKRFLLCSNVLEKDSTLLEEPKHPDFKIKLSRLEMILLDVVKLSSGENIPRLELIREKV